jgi:hypothetical protein
MVISEAIAALGRSPAYSAAVVVAKWLTYAPRFCLRESLEALSIISTHLRPADGLVVTFIPLLLLTGLLTAAVVAAPKPVKEGLVSHEAAGRAFVVRKLPDQKNGGEWWITTGLKVRYVVAGEPGETYTVELWLRLPDEAVEAQRGPGHFDTQELTLPGEGTRLTEAKGSFDRRSQDRPPDDDVNGFPAPPWFKLKPGTYGLVGPALGKAWECRLVMKKRGKVVSDTGYFRIILPPVVEL